MSRHLCFMACMTSNCLVLYFVCISAGRIATVFDVSITDLFVSVFVFIECTPSTVNDKFDWNLLFRPLSNVYIFFFLLHSLRTKKMIGSRQSQTLSLRITASGFLTADLDLDYPVMRSINLDVYTGWVNTLILLSFTERPWVVLWQSGIVDVPVAFGTYNCFELDSKNGGPRELISSIIQRLT